jgi:hypothetical protein
MMILKRDNFREVILAYTKTDWKPLLELLPRIETTDQFCETGGGEKIEEDVFEMPYCTNAEIVSRFLEVVYQIPIVIDFAWSRWGEGRKMVSNKQFDYDTIDIPTKCLLITAIVRNDRFCDGALASSFESGVMLKILKSIEKQLFSEV